MTLADLLTRWWLTASDDIALDKPVELTQDGGSTIALMLDETSVQVGYRLGFINALQIVGHGDVEQPDVVAAAIAEAVQLEERADAG